MPSPETQVSCEGCLGGRAKACRKTGRGRRETSAKTKIPQHPAFPGNASSSPPRHHVATWSRLSAFGRVTSFQLHTSSQGCPRVTQEQMAQEMGFKDRRGQKAPPSPGALSPCPCPTEIPALPPLELLGAQGGPAGTVPAAAHVHRTLSKPRLDTKRIQIKTRKDPF